ncbi:MAG: peptidoglycan recognition family protein [Phycisphaerales bacterium JB039]
MHSRDASVKLGLILRTIARPAIRAGRRRRGTVVWSAFGASMLAGGALLASLDRGPSPMVGGRALVPMMASEAPTSIEAIFTAPASLDRDRWNAIVIHHSGKPYGTPSSIAAEHRARNLVGLGFHFVIGNGRGITDGELHVGYRWLDQLPGAHVSGPQQAEYNEHSIGVCVVGDGERGGFTDAQVDRLSQLVEALMRELEIPGSRVLLHSDLAETADPGPFFPEALLRERLAAAGLD